jgi:hypothetical protein
VFCSIINVMFVCADMMSLTIYPEGCGRPWVISMASRVAASARSAVFRGCLRDSGDVVVVKSPVPCDERIAHQRMCSDPGFMPLIGVGSLSLGGPVCALVLPEMATTLHNMCLHTSPSDGLRCRWAETLAPAVESMHRAGVLHRDIKPGNIFVDFEDKLRIGDFGSAVVDFDSKEDESWDSQGITYMFASDNARSMGRPCRDDDIVSLCYSLFWCSKAGRAWDHDYRRRPSLSELAEDVAVQVVLSMLGRQFGEDENVDPGNNNCSTAPQGISAARTANHNNFNTQKRGRRKRPRRRRS